MKTIMLMFALCISLQVRAEESQRPILVKGPATIVLPGAEFGLKRGDTIKEINGSPVSDQLQAKEVLLQKKKSVSTVTVLRNGKTVKLSKTEPGNLSK